MGRRLASSLLSPFAVALVAIASGCNPLHPQAFFAAPWNDDDACLENNAAVDVYDDESEPSCARSAACVEGPEGDDRLYVTTCQIPEGWREVASDVRCEGALSAYAAGKDGRCE